MEMIVDSRASSTGTSRRNLVVNSNTLDSSTVFRFELVVTERNRDGVGFASLTLRPNTPPRGGTCEVVPRRGITLLTQFTFLCHGWRDNDSPLEYRFATGSKRSLRYQRSIIYKGFRSQYVADSLPLGDMESNYTIYVFITVLDRFGSETEVEMDGEVVVEPLPDASNADVVEKTALALLEKVENNFGDDPQRLTETCGI